VKSLEINEKYKAKHIKINEKYKAKSLTINGKYKAKRIKINNKLLNKIASNGEKYKAILYNYAVKIHMLNTKTNYNILRLI